MTADDFTAAWHEAFPAPHPSPGADVDLALLMDPRPDLEVERRLAAGSDRLVEALMTCAPRGWCGLDAVFVIAGPHQRCRLTYGLDTGDVIELPVSADLLGVAREHRELAARLPAGPWWRLLVTLTPDGAHTAELDRGDEPFPAEHRFPPAVYRADLDRFGFAQERLPTWLAAHVGHANRQRRPAARAVADARADADGGIRAVGTYDELPLAPAMWARWAVLAAGFVALGSAAGPRVRPSHGWFEGATRGRSTLWLLPGDRAVLSGGAWQAPELVAAHRGDAPLPDLFAGAPEWMTDELLDPRSEQGLLSFCYWYEGGRWCRGESQSPDGFARAIPGVWTAATVVDVLTGLAGEDTPRTRQAAAQLVAAAERRTATKELFTSLFEGGASLDIDGAFQQLRLADVILRSDVPPMPERHAIALVRDHITSRGLDSPDYAADALVATRLTVGWMVYAPVPGGGIRINRAVFYVADDGVMEQSSSGEPPVRREAEFERRFRERGRGRG